MISSRGKKPNKLDRLQNFQVGEEQNRMKDKNKQISENLKGKKGGERDKTWNKNDKNKQ